MGNPGYSAVAVHEARDLAHEPEGYEYHGGHSYGYDDEEDMYPGEGKKEEIGPMTAEMAPEAPTRGMAEPGLTAA